MALGACFPSGGGIRLPSCPFGGWGGSLCSGFGKTLPQCGHFISGGSGCLAVSDMMYPPFFCKIDPLFLTRKITSLYGNRMSESCWKTGISGRLRRFFEYAHPAAVIENPSICYVTVEAASKRTNRDYNSKLTLSGWNRRFREKRRVLRSIKCFFSNECFNNL